MPQVVNAPPAVPNKPQRKEDLYIDIDEVNNQNAEVMDRETALNKAYEKYASGGGSHKKKRTPNPIHTPEAEKVIEASNKPQALQDKGSSAYVKQGGGVYTSDNKYYPTTNEKFVPQGYKEGFSDVQSNADFYNWKNGRLVKEKGTAVTVISNEDVPYAQSVEGGGVRITKPIEVTKLIERTKDETTKVLTTPKEEKVYKTYKDIGNPFAPYSGQYEEVVVNNQTVLKPTGKISAFEYINEKLYQVGDYAAEGYKPYFKEGKVKELLFNTPIERPDIATNIFFAPIYGARAFTKEIPFSKSNEIISIIKPNQVVRKTVTDETGNVFVIESKQIKATYLPQDIIKTRVINGEEQTVGKFALRRTTPEQFATATPKGFIAKRLFSPRQISVAPERIDITKSTEVLLNKEGQIVNRPYIKSQRQGANVYGYSRFTGKNIDVAPEQLSKLPSPMKQQVQKRFPLRNLKSIYGAGEVKVIRLGRMNPQTGKFTIAKAGRRTSLGSVVSESTPVYADEGVTVYQTRTSVKDISLPKLKGDIDSLRNNDIFMVGESIVANQPEVISEGSNILARSQTQKLSKGVVSKIGEVRTSLLKSLPTPKVSLPKGLQTATSNVKGTSGIISNVFERPKSIYYGKGLYELTDVQPTFKTVSQQQSVVLDKTTQVSDNRLNSLLTTAQVSKPLQIESQINKLREEQPQIIKSNTREETILKQPSAQAQSQAQRQEQTQVLKSKLLRVPARPQLPRVPTPFIPKVPNPNKQPSKNVLGKVQDLFKVFVRKRGKDIEVGTEFTKVGAATKLKNILRGNIAASGYVSSNLGKVKASELGFGSEFTQGKRELFRLVQRREKRLGARSEVKEIQFFKKQKKGRFKWL